MQIFGYSLQARLSALILPALMVLELGCSGSSARIQAPAELSYTKVSVDAVVGQPITALVPTVKGVVRSYSLSPTLPPGLTFNPTTGVIEGTPTQPFPDTAFTVTASNEAGFDWVSLQLSVAGWLPDLRFQWAGAFETYVYGNVSETISSGLSMTLSYSGLLHWGPLLINSPTQDGWTCMGVGVNVPLVGGTRSSYSAGYLNALDVRLDDFAQQGMIITSLDLSVQGFGVVATGPNGNANEYSSARATVASLAALAALGQEQGRLGAVITAVATPGKTYNNAPGTGQILALWSRRQSDRGTYEVQVVSGTPAELSQLLPALGQQGFVITAFGAGDQQNFIAVGTRPTGSAVPHTIWVSGPGSTSGPTLKDGFLPIGMMSDGARPEYHWVYQR